MNEDVKKMQVGASLLEGKALTWWRTECAKDSTALTSWSLVDLVSGLEQAFSDVDREKKLRDRLQQLK